MTLATKMGQIELGLGAVGASNMHAIKSQRIGRSSASIFRLHRDGVADYMAWAGKGDEFLVINQTNDGDTTHDSKFSLLVDGAARDDNGRFVMQYQILPENDGTSESTQHRTSMIVCLSD